MIVFGGLIDFLWVLMRWIEDIIVLDICIIDREVDYYEDRFKSATYFRPDSICQQ